MVRENSVRDMKLNGPVFYGSNNEEDPNQEFVDGLENFGEELENEVSSPKIDTKGSPRDLGKLKNNFIEDK